MKKLICAILSVCMLLAIFAGCGSGQSGAGGSPATAGGEGAGDAAATAPSGDNVIYLGLNYELTGDNPIIGESSIQGVNLAIEEINAAGGITIGGTAYQLAVKPLDNEFNAESAAVVAQTFVDDPSIVAQIGPNDSAMCLGAAAVVEGEGLPTITPWATNVDITEGDYFFRACYDDFFQGEILAKYAYEGEKAQTAAILYDMSNDYNVGVAENFRKYYEELGGQVVEYQSYNAGEKDFTAQLTKIVATTPDILLLPNFYAEVVDQAEQAVSLGFEGRFLGSDTWGDQLLLDLDTNHIFEGCVWVGHYALDIASDKALAFIDAYHEKYGTDIFPNDIVALNYDAVNLMAIENAQSTDRTAIRDAMANIEFYEGVTGNMEFKGSGTPVKSAVMIKIENGEFKFLELINP